MLKQTNILHIWSDLCVKMIVKIVGKGDPVCPRRLQYEVIMGKGENALYKDFLHFPCSFL